MPAVEEVTYTLSMQDSEDLLYSIPLDGSVSESWHSPMLPSDWKFSLQLPKDRDYMCVAPSWAQRKSLSFQY